MADIVDARTRSRMMSRIRGRNTKPELALRKGLHSLGFRYRLHKQGMPGRPDLVLPRYQAAIFVHGCFWHRHSGCRYCTMPASNIEFWQAKFSENSKRDFRNTRELLANGWRVAIVWECQLSQKHAAKTTESVARWLESSCKFFEPSILAKASA
ncbi:very short patch repair endonuclease [Tardiphaga sp. 11_C7_N12_6]|uniref:very short patch repair endonuclease n=1 Tax=Tardiphaga sp. 11_C7_N12_6 TaxID=3240789 RepID=UPI003F1F019B